MPTYKDDKNRYIQTVQVDGKKWWLLRGELPNTFNTGCSVKTENSDNDYFLSEEDLINGEESLIKISEFPTVLAGAIELIKVIVKE